MKENSNAKQEMLNDVNEMMFPAGTFRGGEQDGELYYITTGVLFEDQVW